MPRRTKLSERRALRRQTDVAHAGQIESGADRGAVHGGYYRNLKFVECQRNALDPIAVAIAQGVRRAGENASAISHVLDVSTGTEGFAGTGQDHRSHRQVTSQIVAKIREFLHLRRISERIARLGPVHVHGNNITLTFNR
jgi:hypothetical protein